MSQNEPFNSLGVPASESKVRPAGLAAKVSEWNACHPVLAIALVSLLAVAVNCYPVIFCGKSYVSPMSSGDELVYNWWPPLPGMERWPAPTPTERWPGPASGEQHSTHGSDTGAMMWWGVPMGFVESRSLLHHGELPLWNRYGHAGETLIGQAVSMLGDPLHLIVIFGHGSAWAWDCKFLAAKYLFCFGFGLLVRRLVGSHSLSLIYAALAAYCGAYFYVNSHPVFFVLAYAPWILLAAMEWLDRRSAHPGRWALIWLLANFACFNAGHVEVAVDLIGGLNLAALAGVLAGRRDFASLVWILARMVVGALLFFGLTAPVWLPFLATLAGAYTAHAEVSVVQLPPTSVAGAFDDLFYLALRPMTSEAALAPGTSLLILAGCGFSLWHWQQLKGEPFYWINSAAIGLWGGFVFGWVPASFIATIPLLNRVGHVFTDFSYLLVIHLTIQSAYGFKCLARADNLRQAAGGFACVTGMFAAIFILFGCGQTPRPVAWNQLICGAAAAVGAPLLFVFLKNRPQPTLVGWSGILILVFIPHFRFGLYNFGNDALLMLPGPRVTLNAHSPAIDRIKAQAAEPFRVAGLQRCLTGNYAAVYELEDIRSCAPLSNGEYVNLIRRFPGMVLKDNWVIEVVNPALAQPLLNLLNVKYLLTWRDVSVRDKPGFRVVDLSDFGVLENEQAWPRAFFASRVSAIDSSEDFIKHLVENGRQPFIALAGDEIQKQSDLKSLASTNPPSIVPAINYRLSVNSTEFDIHAPAAGVVCLTEGQAKDFAAMANGKAKPVLTVNRAFQGIYLDQPGDYHISFTYRPRYWRLAGYCFLISLGGAIVLARAIRQRSPAQVTGESSPVDSV